LHAAQLRQGSPNDGSGYELDAIAAVAIGGTSMAGGKGTIVGTVVGVLILGILNNMLQLNNVDINLQLVLKGLIIIAAVVLQKERKK
jgi:ribose transport system permease protein